MRVWKSFASTAVTAVVVLSLIGTGSQSHAAPLPNLTATKSNNTGDFVDVFSSFEWTILVQNIGLGAPEDA
ncbi:MAG: hypothetical protein GY725_25450 [bacterium]|nr:hypothetical protein [bacterium]